MRPFSPAAPWRLRPDVIFLNHGSFGACPVPVLEHQRALQDELESGPVAFLATSFEDRIDAARQATAAFLGADPAGLVFVPNATTGVSTVLRSLRFEPGDELLTIDHEYNAALNALAEVAHAAGAKVVTAHLPLEIESDEQVLETVLAAVTARTRLVLVSQITSPTATILPVAALVRELDARGIDTLVDGAHAPGQVPLDLRSVGAAYWTGNCHKWVCSPKGSAILVVREDRRSLVRPLTISHGWNDARSDRSRLWKEFDWTGTGDPTAILALPTAIEVMGRLHPDGWPGVMAANHALALDGRDRVARALGVATRVPDRMFGSMAIIPLPIAPTEAAARALKATLMDEDRIEVPIVTWPVPAARRSPTDPPSALAVRISAQLYNEPADYDRLAVALARRLGAALARRLGER